MGLAHSRTHPPPSFRSMVVLLSPPARSTSLRVSLSLLRPKLVTALKCSVAEAQARLSHISVLPSSQVKHIIGRSVLQSNPSSASACTLDSNASAALQAELTAPRARQMRRPLLNPLHLPYYGVCTPENRNAPTPAYVTLLSLPYATYSNVKHGVRVLLSLLRIK